MRGFILGLSLSVAFIAGSLLGSLGESTADAQSGRQRWEYKCIEGYNNSTIQREASAAGAQGWELTGVGAGSRLQGTWCFKRPL